jgi:hypothetical protein
MVVASDNSYAERETTPTLDNLCHAGDLDYTLIVLLFQALIFGHFRHISGPQSL